MAEKDESKQPETDETEVEESAETEENTDAAAESADEVTESVDSEDVAADADDSNDEAADADDSDDEAADAEDADDEAADADDSDDDKATTSASKAAAVETPVWREDIDYVVAKPEMGDANGMLALFDHPDDILWAAEKTRDRGFERWDVLTPFPVHGMDDAMGLGRSWIPYATFTFAMCGLLTATTIEYGTMFFDWPIIIGGKPFFAWPSFVPIMFELTVLFAGIGTAVTMFRAGGMPNPKPVILDTRLSRDRFGVWISAEDAKFDLTKTRKFLEGLSPVEIREIRSDA